MDNIARINGKDLRISTKQCVEICSFIREKKVAKAKYALERVLKKKMAVPFKRYNRDIGHKHGIASGSYPINASSEILRLLIELEANAENKGLSKNELYISKIMAKMFFHYTLELTCPPFPARLSNLLNEFLLVSYLIFLFSPGIFSVDLLILS